MLLACLLVGLRWWYAFLSGWVTLAAHVDHSDLVSFVVVVSLGHFISLYRSLSALLLLNSYTRETLCRLGFVSFVLVAGRWSCPVCLKGLMKTLFSLFVCLTHLHSVTSASASASASDLTTSIEKKKNTRREYHFALVFHLGVTHTPPDT